ncbi:expressed unknown protein [Seminavis robusta]|uniref:BHLH domain-containing protein n=1 Tax=Seminavis robusta TaxID=568900 RepID=A0A9N8EK90_9STRA|nr:expressed unknown protein [Seminavis robusta]|eukprot:Sro1397_g269160.1 n/a (345) ;mRNA; f:7413-8627
MESIPSMSNSYAVVEEATSKAEPEISGAVSSDNRNDEASAGPGDYWFQVLNGLLDEEDDQEEVTTGGSAGASMPMKQDITNVTGLWIDRSPANAGSNTATYTHQKQEPFNEGRFDAVITPPAVPGCEMEQPCTKKRKRCPLTDEQRIERNSREQARSGRLTNVFAELREVLMSSGVVVTRGTKDTVLSAAIELIKKLEHNQGQMDMTNKHMARKIEEAKGAQAIAETSCQQSIVEQGRSPHTGAASLVTVHEHPQSVPSIGCTLPPGSTNHDMYTMLFHSSAAGMAIATLGGNIKDCNQVFCFLAQTSRDHVLNTTVFNWVAKEDQHRAYQSLLTMLGNLFSCE